MPSGIDLITSDHQIVNDLFDRFGSTGDASVVGEVLDALKAHDDAERAALYPMAAVVLGEAAPIEHALHSHHEVRAQIAAVSSLEGPGLVAAFDELRLLVQAHVEEEERDLLPAIAARATPQQLEALGARFLQAKQRGG